MPVSIRFNFFVFVLLIPVIHVLATILTPYFPSGSLHPGTVRAGVLLLFILYFSLTRFEWNLPNTIIALFLLYYLCLVFMQSSDLFGALYEYNRVLLWAFMFPIGYYFFTSKFAFRKLNRVYIVILIILCADVILANLFGYGDSSYGEDTVSYGGAGVNITKMMGLILLMAPVSLCFANTERMRILMVSVFVISGILILLGLKRSALVAMLGGGVIYLILSPQRMRAVFGLGIAVCIAIACSPIYFDDLLERYETRRNAIEEVIHGDFQEEGRFNADVLPALKVWWDGSLRHKLFGSEIFRPDLVVKGRNMHVDYARNLVGTGLVGLILFMLIYLVIGLELHRYFRVVRDNVLAREIYAVFYASLFAILLMGYAGTMMGISLRALLFLYWGAMVGVMRQMAFEELDSHSLKPEMVEESVELGYGAK